LKLRKNMVFAHRGLHNKEVKENTLASFRRAIENGYGIELDVRMTRDKVLIAFHDSTFNGVKIEDTYLSDLDTDTPTIKETLELIEKMNGVVLLEVKKSRHIKELRESLMKQIKYVNINFAIISFNPRTVRWFKKNGCIVGQSIEDCNMPRRLKQVSINASIKISDPDFLVVEKTLLQNSEIKKLREKLKIISWTIQSESEKKEALSLSDNIIFDEY